MGQFFQPDFLNNVCTVLPRTTKFSRITRGEGCISRGQPRPYRKVAVPQRSPILEVPSIYVDTLWRRTTEFRRGNTYREGASFRISHAPTSTPPQGVPVSALLNFEGLCVHPLSQSYQI